MEHGTTWQRDVMVSAAAEGMSVPEAAERTDMQLVAMVLGGDEDAFEEIFERYKRMTASIAARYFRCPQDAEEAVQTAFAKMFAELRSFRGGHDTTLAGWLGKITANACLDILRKQKRRPEGSSVELPETDDADRLWAGLAVRSGEKVLVDRDLAGKLLSRLNAEDRVVLRMMYADDLSVAETARMMGWSQTKTKVRAWRAKNALRKILNEVL